ncbi:secreted protein [Streptomyces sviceus ATCC 29083]|uniref:Secreted protein n=2 Tax=Streptomyces TaxID=1883 RepID=B5I0S8_STRX2|nr:secreted protein [Streptomyces sviceus ATCC 29083]
MTASSAPALAPPCLSNERRPTMPLHVPPAPAPALRSVLTALASPTAVREARTPSLLRAQGPVTPELPLPVHILDGTGTRLAGWRFLIRCGERSVAAAETMLTPDGWAFSHFFEGPYIASTERALRQAEVMQQPYQPRLLSIPGLYMLALWLHGDCAADAGTGRLAATDLLVPLAPAPPGIAAHRPHRAAELLPVLTHRVTPAPLLGSPA